MSFKKKWNAFLEVVYRILSGILVFIAFFLVLIVGFFVFISSSKGNFSTTLILFVAIGIVIYFYRKRKQLRFNRKNSSWLYFKEILRVVMGVVILFFITTNISFPDPLVKNKALLTSEKVVLREDSLGDTHRRFYESTQSWYDFSRQKHSMTFTVDFDSVSKSKANRESFKADYKKFSKYRKANSSKNVYYSFFWNSLYNNLVTHDKPLIEQLSSEFNYLRKEKTMNRREFAELMITAIQDIPYVLIRSDSCKVNDVKPCVGDIKFGLYAPAEYISNLQGDCDTRTVLLFTLLSRFNYDVAIVNSKAYKHSMLGINLPSSGKYKTYRNKKYYFVETTSRHCPIGYLPNDFSKISNWDFALIHKI